MGSFGLWLFASFVLGFFAGKSMPHPRRPKPRDEDAGYLWRVD